MKKYKSEILFVLFLVTFLVGYFIFLYQQSKYKPLPDPTYTIQEEPTVNVPPVNREWEDSEFKGS